MHDQQDLVSDATQLRGVDHQFEDEELTRTHTHTWAYEFHADTGNEEMAQTLISGEYGYRNADAKTRFPMKSLKSVSTSCT
jgi:hypothetical protein